MEEITEGVNNINITGAADLQKKNRIQVSNTKKPLFFYVNLAKVNSAFLSLIFFSFSVCESVTPTRLAQETII